MTIADLAFWLFAAGAIVSGWRVFRTNSMVRASFLLLLSFICVAAIMLLLAAAYIGFATIFMMAAEMMVMALFMVMFMMNPAGLNPMWMVHQHRLSIAAGALTFVGLMLAILLSGLPEHRVGPGPHLIRALGSELLGGSMLVFETAGITLLAAMVGAVILSSRSGRFGPADHGSRPPGLQPGGEPAGCKPEAEESSPMHHIEHCG